MNITSTIVTSVISAIFLNLTPTAVRGSVQLGNVEPPRKVKDVKPVYPPKSLEAGDEGMVIIEFQVDESGSVTGTRVLFSKCPALDDAALTAVRAWRFEPTTRNGKPVASQGTAQIPFRLPPRLKSRAQRPGACKWVEPPKPVY